MLTKSLPELVDAINGDLKLGGYDGRVDEDMLSGAYAVTSLVADVTGLAPTEGDPDVDAILRRVPMERGPSVVVVGIAVHRHGSPDGSADRTLWAMDFADRCAYTEGEAWRRYSPTPENRSA